MPTRKRRNRARRAAPKRRARSAPTYHHGDLRRALLHATGAVLEADGLERFTLREVARRAGVSHGAPAHHFGDVRGLLSEFTAESFAELAATMQRNRERASADAFDQLAAVGAAYIEYALANRARFQLMFRSDRLDAESAPLATSGGAAYGHLQDCIARIAREIDTPAYAIQEKTALAWSIVHGYATLLLDNEKFALQVTAGHASRALPVLAAMLQLSRPAFAATGGA